MIALVCSLSNALKYAQDVAVEREDDIHEQAQQAVHPEQLDEDEGHLPSIRPPRGTSPHPRSPPSPGLQVLFFGPRVCEYAHSHRDELKILRPIYS